MSHLKLVTPKRQYLFQEAWTDFLLSRQAKLVSPSTIRTYKYTAGKFTDRLISIGIKDPPELKPLHIRRFLANHSKNGRCDSYIHCNARAIKIFFRFLLDDRYIKEPIGAGELIARPQSINADTVNFIQVNIGGEVVDAPWQELKDDEMDER